MNEDLIQQLADMLAENLRKSVKEILNTDEAAEYMGMSKSHLYKLTMRREVPHYKPGGRICYFKRSELDEWMLQNPVATVTDLNTAALVHCMTRESPAQSKMTTNP